MAKFKRRFYRKKKNSFFRNVARYHYTKVSVSTTLQYTGNTIKFKITSTSNFELHSALVAAPDWTKYANLFTTFKLRGVGITVNPHPTSTPFVGGTAQLAFLTDSDNATFGECVESNKSISLPYTGIRKLYMKYPGGATGFMAMKTPDLLPGKLAAGVSEGSTSGEMTWDITMDFYILFKNEL